MPKRLEYDSDDHEAIVPEVDELESHSKNGGDGNRDLEVAALRATNNQLQIGLETWQTAYANAQSKHTQEVNQLVNEFTERELKIREDMESHSTTVCSDLIAPPL